MIKVQAGRRKQIVSALGKHHYITDRSLILIFSDGWDLGQLEVLREAMRRIRRRSHKILWLNPLMGCPDYQPICQGRAAALPWVDRLLPGHNISAFGKLAEKLVEGLVG